MNRSKIDASPAGPAGRLESLLSQASAQFQQAFGAAPEWLARAPGRINLIGEHTDYSHLPVLPAAIDRDVVVAVGSRSDGLVVARSGAVEGEVRLAVRGGESPGSGWGRYLKGALETVQEDDRRAGASLLVHSDLPTTGGLSSSSALTVAAILALRASWGLPRDVDYVVDAAIGAERIVGVESGGMDQNVIARAIVSCALRIDFAPLRVVPVPLPEAATWVVASSGVVAAKGGAAKDHYNARVVATRIAAARLAQQLGAASEPLPRLSRFSNDAGLAAARGLTETEAARDAAAATGVPLDALVALSAGRYRPEAAVPVRTSAVHVLEEARRVDAAVAALGQGDLPALGALLDASHASLQQFGASTPELDDLCARMRGAGALGARLTGAGFGGYALALAVPETVGAVVEAGAAYGGAFVVRPSGGAEVLQGGDP